ncbi:Dystrophin [Manis pentadactyla]|nr:Dystrophin [Manis pentadactyla]
MGSSPQEIPIPHIHGGIQHLAKCATGSWSSSEDKVSHHCNSLAKSVQLYMPVAELIKCLKKWILRICVLVAAEAPPPGSRAAVFRRHQEVMSLVGCDA